MSKLKSILVLACLTVLCTSFAPYFNVTIPTGTQNYQYSPDQRILAVAAPTQLDLFAAQTGVLIQKIPFADPLSLVSFAFNANSSLLGLGFENGDAIIYQLSGSQYVKTNWTFSAGSVTSIQSLCFTSDNNNLILGLKQNEIVAWHFPTNTNTSTAFGGQFVNVVACSPTDPTSFVGGGAQLTNAKFTFYTYDQNTIAVAKDAGAKTGTGVQDACFTADGTEVYRVGNDGVIYVYNSTTYEQSTITDPAIAGKVLYKVRMTANLRLVATVYTGNAVVLNEASSLSAQVYPTLVPSIALSLQGGYLFTVPNANQGSTLSQCPVGQFSDDLGNCVGCNPSCSACFARADQCYGCASKHFLDGTTCQKCVLGCLACSDATTCNTCDINFHKQNSVCVCDKGFFQQDQTCVACSTGCVTCTNQTVCTQCDPLFNLVDDVCLCKAASYPFNNTCLPCQRGCLQCKDGASCDSCNTDQHYVVFNNSCVCDTDNKFVDDGTNCVCTPGYYEESKVCLKCPLGCVTCTSATLCQTCTDGLEIRGGVCKCIDPQAFLDVDQKCKSCNSTLKYCIQCTNANQCLNCQLGTNRVPVDGHCVCDKKYWEDANQTCQLCTIPGCLHCQNGDTCLQCDGDNGWQLNSTTNLCQCEKHHSQIANVCVECPVGCSSCASQTECLTCDKDEHWIFDFNSTDCVCEDGWFRMDRYCLNCVAGCLKCDTYESCSSCDVTRNFVPYNGSCVCASGYFPQDQNCWTCAVIRNCLQCTSAKTCTKCDNNLVLNKTHQCGCAAEHQFVNDNNVCEDCPEGCSACNNADECTECADGYYLDDKVCKKNGMDVLVIVLIVVGVIVLAGAIFVIIKCIKKRRSPLSQDDYEQL